MDSKMGDLADVLEFLKPSPETDIRDALADINQQRGVLEAADEMLQIRAKVIRAQCPHTNRENVGSGTVLARSECIACGHSIR